MKISTRLIIAVLILTSVLAYLNSLLNPFIWDDIPLIAANFHIKSISFIPKLFTENIYHYDKIGRFYRPVLMTTFAVDHELWGEDPYGYHFTNLCIHISNAILIYFIISTLFSNRLLASLTAYLFALHPIHTEAVTYISGRADPLSAFFCLSSFLFFINCLKGNRRSVLLLIFSVISFTLGIFSKESAIVLPVIFVFYEAFKGNGRLSSVNFRRYAPFVAAIFFYAIVRHFALRGAMDISLTNNATGLGNRLLTMPEVMMKYAGLLLWPAGLHMERNEFLYDAITLVLDPRFYAPLAVILILLTTIWSLRDRMRPLFFGTVWFMVFLSPFLNIIPLNAFVAEHWLYLPSVGFFLGVSSIFQEALKLRSIRLCVAGFILIVIAMLGVLTMRQNYIWRNPAFFYKYTIRHSPLSTRSYNNLGTEYFKLGLYKDAERQFRRALILAPDSPYVKNHIVNIASSMYKQGKEKEALGLYRGLIDKYPDFAMTYLLLGSVYSSKHDTDKAIFYYRRAVELMPENAYYWQMLGDEYEKAGAYDEAIESYKKTLDLYPGYSEAKEKLGKTTPPVIDK